MQAPAGLPLVRYGLLSLLEQVYRGEFSIELVVIKIAHNPARRFHIQDRGFIREGYFADLVLVDPDGYTRASHGESLSLCGWTPFDGIIFHHSIDATFVNGKMMFEDQQQRAHSRALPLQFNR